MSLAKTAKAMDLQGLMRGRVLDLFRRMCRQVPRMVQLYEIPYTAHDMRHIIALLFKKNAHVRDPRLIDLLISKGEMEMEETLMQWKQRPHVLAMLQLDGKALDAGGDGESIIDNQAWIAEFVERAEMAAGKSVDAPRLRAIVGAARKMEMEGVPAQELAAATDDVTEEFTSAHKRGSKWMFDTVASIESGEYDLNPNVGSMRDHDLSADMRNLKALAYGERKLSLEEKREARFNAACELEQGKGPSVRPPAAVADKGLPLWVASKIHWPWIDAAQEHDDARVTAAVEAAKDDLMSAHADDEAYEAWVAEQMQAMDSDPLRYGRVR